MVTPVAQWHPLITWPFCFCPAGAGRQSVPTAQRGELLSAGTGTGTCSRPSNPLVLQLSKATTAPDTGWKQVKIGIDPYKVFQDADWALLIGAKPRGPGMERAALLDINGQIFQTQVGLP